MKQLTAMNGCSGSSCVHHDMEFSHWVSEVDLSPFANEENRFRGALGLGVEVLGLERDLPNIKARSLTSQGFISISV